MAIYPVSGRQAITGIPFLVLFVLSEQKGRDELSARAVVSLPSFRCQTSQRISQFLCSCEGCRLGQPHEGYSSREFCQSDHVFRPRGRCVGPGVELKQKPGAFGSAGQDGYRYGGKAERIAVDRRSFLNELCHKRKISRSDSCV